jgi:hypothetical protein
MKDKIFTLAIALAVSLGTTALLAHSERAARPVRNAAQSLDTDGAFRDGLYVGRLAAESGEPYRPLVGRWSSDADRASFRKGYLSGYTDSNGRAGSARAEQAE